jgi:hypothetical protein
MHSAARKKYPLYNIEQELLTISNDWDNLANVNFYTYSVDKNKLKSWNSAQMNIGGSTTPAQQPVNQYQQQAKSYQNQNNTNYQQPANNNTANINPNNTVPGKSNTGLIIAGVAAAALPFLFFMKKSPVNTPAKKSSK